MKNKFVNHARNVWDRTVTIHPRIDVFWWETLSFFIVWCFLVHLQLLILCSQVQIFLHGRNGRCYRASQAGQRMFSANFILFHINYFMPSTIGDHCVLRFYCHWWRLTDRCIEQGHIILLTTVWRIVLFMLPLRFIFIYIYGIVFTASYHRCSSDGWRGSRMISVKRSRILPSSSRPSYCSHYFVIRILSLLHLFMHLLIITFLFYFIYLLPYLFCSMECVHQIWNEARRTRQSQRSIRKVRIYRKTANIGHFSGTIKLSLV